MVEAPFVFGVWRVLKLIESMKFSASVAVGSICGYFASMIV